MSQNGASAGSDSERLSGFLRRLHPLTQLLVVAVLVHLAASVVTAIATLALPTFAQQNQPFVVRLAQQAHGITYSILLFGTAATVEFLFRIWSELRLARRPD
jgi:uncharacterized membrane protein